MFLVSQAGVIASMQPYHAIDDGRWARGGWPVRIKSSYVFRSLLDAGRRWRSVGLVRRTAVSDSGNSRSGDTPDDR